MRKKRYFLLGNVLLLLLLIVALAGGTFAYWSNLNKNNYNTVIIGEGTELLLTVTAQPEEGKVLVPANNAIADNEVESVTLQYTVRLNQHTVQDLNLSVTATDVLIDGKTDLAGLVNIAITKPDTVNNADVSVSAVVTLAEPDTADNYNAIINKPITFTLSFLATMP